MTQQSYVYAEIYRPNGIGRNIALLVWRLNRAEFL